MIPQTCQPPSPSPFPGNIAVLGASGSIGTAALEVIAASGGVLRAAALSVHHDTAKLAEAACRFRPAVVAVADQHADRAPLSRLPAGTEVLFGPESLETIARRADVDTVLCAVVGCAGLRSTLAAVEAGKTLALANKESLVTGGELVMDAVRRRGAALFPVDSEHSAIYQSLRARSAAADPLVAGQEVKSLVLTASGGPFKDRTAEELKSVTIGEALAHPTWKMGKMITIDSATRMHKAFDRVEACWLFGITPDRIEVMIHPQSVIHSMVEFIDSAVVAQLSPPDMRLPIQLALYRGRRLGGPARRFDWRQPLSFEMVPVDEDRFPAIRLGREVASRGGSCGAVVNAANETAVEAFLSGRLPFHKIVAACQAVLGYHQFEAPPTLDRLFELDAWARKET
ncbi:MAG: 1-deoxy-D-xylulose-5-phosphate reductoisomerase [Thermoguttaceae bacterium]|nr:1-deoxy-D-xylulose-5-phosphate reductoisomerase [Thermoguttaceae bacterium]